MVGGQPRKLVQCGAGTCLAYLDPTSGLEDSVGLRHHLFRLGIDLSCYSRRGSRSAAVPAWPRCLLGAGGVLFVARIVEGDRFPDRKQWASLFFLAILLFVFDYGLLFWAEQRVPSGVAAIMMATIPLFMTLSEIAFLRSKCLTIRLGGALLLGLGGVTVLVSRSVSLGGEPIDRRGALALIFGGLSWSVASALTRKLPLPESKVMNSGAQMLAGGILLAFTAAGLGEFPVSFIPAASPQPPGSRWFI